MISNERQYRIAKANAEKFRAAIDSAPPTGRHPKAIAAMQGAARMQLAEIEKEIREYEALASGQVVTFRAESLIDLGSALIRARIARKLSQKALAALIDVAQQQVQRYEAAAYQNVPIATLQKIAEALNVSIQETLTLNPDQSTRKDDASKKHSTIGTKN